MKRSEDILGVAEGSSLDRLGSQSQAAITLVAIQSAFGA